MHLPGRCAVTVVLVTGLLAGTTACGDSGDDPGDPTEALAAAKKLLDETSGVALELTAEELPDDVDGLEDAKGVATHAPAFKGDITLRVDGLSLQVPVIAVDGLVFAKLPFTTEYTVTDPAEFGAPDPAQLMDATTGISSWLSEASDVEKGDAERDGETVLTSYDGTLSGETVAATIPGADQESDFAVRFLIAGDGQVRSMEISGPFYGEDEDVDYTIRLTDYGADEDIVRP